AAYAADAKPEENQPSGSALVQKLRYGELLVVLRGREDAHTEILADAKESLWAPEWMFIEYYTKPDRNDAETYFRESLANARDQSAYLTVLGAIYNEWKTDNLAREKLGKAIELNPNNFMAWYYKGIFLLRREEFEDAAAALARVIAIDPTFAPAHLAMGNLYRAKKDPDKAIEEYREAIKDEPKLFDARYNMGILLGEKGKTDESLSEIQKAGELSPQNFDVQMNLAALYERMDRQKDALAAYERAAAARPSRADILEKIAKVYKKIGDKDKEYAAWDAAVQADPGLYEALLELGLMALAKGEYDKAERSFMEAAKKNPDDYKLYLGLARVQMKKEDYRKALDYYRRALLIESASKDAKDELAGLQKRFNITTEKYTGKTINVVYQNFQTKVMKVYKILLARTPGLKGAVSVKVTVDSDGNVTEAGMDNSTLKNKELELAIYGNALMAKFPPGPKGMVYAMPIKLSPAM
ncbi:MAG: tetratricopeptide repeat protein, partial [Myxococcota bacterium]